MIHPESPAGPKRWIGPALAALLLATLALRTWDASKGLNSNRYYDERYTLKNVSALLKHGDIRPRHSFYLSLSYLPQAAVLAASQSLYRVTRYQPFSIYAKTSDGYSPTAYWLCRMVNVSYAVLSLWLLFLIGRRIHSPEAGLLAAAILAAFPRHVLSSVEFKPDILVILLVTLTFYWTLGAAVRPSLARFLGVGFGVGLAVSAKYTGIAAAIPIGAAVLTEGRRDRRQWGWLLLAGLTSVATFVALNPFLGVVFRSIPPLVQSYAGRSVKEQSSHWVVFRRQIEFLVEHHGPVVAAFVALGIAGMLWRIARPVPRDPPERRLGSILVLSLLLGYSLLHSLGMTLFRGQNYLPVVPFSSLTAAWAMVELWRMLARRARWLAWRPVAALLWLGVVAALLARQGALVYDRMVPTNFEVANESLLSRLEPLGLRHVIHEEGMGAFQVAGRPRRPLVSRVERLSRVDRAFLDRTDVEVFPRRRLDGTAAPFYRGRLARLPRTQVEILESRPFRSRGETVVMLRHLWSLSAEPLELRVRRPEGVPFLVGRFPEGLALGGETVSMVLWVPRESASRRHVELRLDPGGRPVPLADTGRRLNRFFRMSPRFRLTGQEVRVRIPAKPEDRPRGFGVEVYRWRSGTDPAGAPNARSVRSSGP
jgi:dolichyl-phosphate-mannose-protein mannosyltransferase